MKSQKSILAAVVTAWTVLVVAGPAVATIHHIDVGNFFFSLSGTVVSPGDTVRWQLVAGTHTTAETSSPKFWDSGILSAGAPFDVVFTAADGPGSFAYLCTIHPTTMKDTIFMAAPQTTQQDVADYVRDNILGGTYDDVTKWMPDSWLDQTHVVRDINPDSSDIPFPYPRTWFVMVDLTPEANWGHDVMWVFVRDDLMEHTVVGTPGLRALGCE